jgi:hypothetical protein
MEKMEKYMEKIKINAPGVDRLFPTASPLNALYNNVLNPSLNPRRWDLHRSDTLLR